MKRDNQANWEYAATIYAAVKGNNRYSNFCKEYAQKYFGPLDGLNVLDAGCGDGEYTEIFRTKGACAYGCDGSSAVIETAKRKNPFCHFDVVDLSKVVPYEDDLFDLVFCNLVLMDIDPIFTTAKELYRILRSSGKLHFSIVHPAFYLADWARNDEGCIVSKNVMNYIKPTEIVQLWETQPVIHYHRPISYYYNLFADAGFRLKSMDEPSVYESEKIPDIPLYLFSVFEK
jgi:SAM-dependent methyltransferase